MSGTTKITTKQLNINNNLDLQNNVLKNGGFEVVTSLPTTNLFVGRQVCYQGKDYVYDGTAWKNDADTLGGYNISNFYGNFESSVLPILNQQRTNIGNPSVFEAAVIDSQFTNKVWFFPISYTTFERSTDDITYNIASDITDDQKRRLFGGAGNTNANISIPKGQYLRITLDATGYCRLNMLYLWYAYHGDNSYIKIEKYSLNTASWSNVIDYQRFGSWPAHTVVRHPGLFFANYNTTTHFSRVRITIKVDADTSGGVYTDHILNNIEWWGGYPDGRRTIYYNDGYKNVYFPAAVQSNETINCDINTIAPTQTGKVTKTSTWWWQYLIQCVHFLYASIRYLSNGYLPRWNSTTQRFENSKLYDNGTNVGIGTTSPTEALDVVGSVKSSTGFKKGDIGDTNLLLAGGGDKPISDLATSASLNGYLPLTGGTLTGDLTTKDIYPTEGESIYIGGSENAYEEVWAKYFRGLADEASKVTNGLRIQYNGTTQGSFNGSEEVIFNITPSSIGAANSSHTHTKSQITDLTVDAALSSISTNPVQNKIVNTAINSKFSTSGGLISGNVQINPCSAGYSEGIRIANAPNNYSAIILGCNTSYGYTGTNVGMWAINKNSNNTFSIKYCTSAGSGLSEGLTLNPDGDATWKGNTLACLGNIPVGGTNQAFPVADIGSTLTNSVYNYFFDIGDNTFSLDLTSSTTLKNIAIGQLYNIYFNSLAACNIEFRDTLLNVTLNLTKGKRVKCEVLKISSSRAELVYYTIN